jgi:MFS family permease
MAKYGRRWSIVLASAIFNIGAIVQTINTHSLAAFYVARVVSGVGVGMATVVIPAYSAEMAPKNIRGTLGSFFQFFFTLGVMTSYWIDYAVHTHMSDSTAQWQVPVGLQLVPGAILGLGMLLTKESVRWLAKQGRHEDAMKSLAWVRGGEDDEVRAEFNEILAGIQEEAKDKSGVTWRELALVPTNRNRVLLIICLQVGVQLTGNTSMAYCESFTLLPIKSSC